MKMKKIFAMLLALIMVLAAAGCTNSGNQSSAKDINAKSEGVMTYAEYAAAAQYADVKIEAYVQDAQSWWSDKITVYLADKDGAYFAYEMACSEADAKKLVPGTKIRVTGVKDEWSGEVELQAGSTFEFVNDGLTYKADPLDVTSMLGSDDLIKHMNEKVSFKGMKIEAMDDGTSAFYYNWDNSGKDQADADLYFNASYNGQTYSFVVEYYLRGSDSDVYKAVTNLKVGDTVDMEGFLYWYNGPNPQITSITVK